MNKKEKKEKDFDDFMNKTFKNITKEERMGITYYYQNKKMIGFWDSNNSKGEYGDPKILKNRGYEVY
jgi:hypothetical protein